MMASARRAFRSSVGAGLGSGLGSGLAAGGTSGGFKELVPISKSGPNVVREPWRCPVRSLVSCVGLCHTAAWFPQY